MSSTNHSVYDAISPSRHIVRMVSLQVHPKPLTLNTTSETLNPKP